MNYARIRSEENLVECAFLFLDPSFFTTPANAFLWWAGDHAHSRVIAALYQQRLRGALHITKRTNERPLLTPTHGTIVEGATHELCTYQKRRESCQVCILISRPIFLCYTSECLSLVGGRSCILMNDCSLISTALARCFKRCLSLPPDLR